MGREKDAKGEGKTKQKPTKLKRLNGCERAGAGDDVKISTKKTKSKSAEKTDHGKPHKKVKTPKTETLESTRASESVKQEPQDDDFTTKKKGLKRKRVKDEPVEGASQSPASPRSKKKNKEHGHGEGSDEESQKKKKSKKNKEKTVKKEEGEQPVSKKPKKTKEEIEEARQLKIKKKEEEEQNRWRWWEEEKYEDGVKWKFLEHNGPYFPPEYQRLPDSVHFYYNGTEVKLSPAAEEVALFFAQMLDHEYTTKKVFRENFFEDWRKEMTSEERRLIQDINKCDFGELHAMHKAKVEERKNMTKEEKQALKEANQKIVDEYGYCMLDHHKERIGNFKIEPPGLFRGRGEHPKQGMLKKRIQPEDVIINCSKDSRVPEPPAGHRWKEVRHDSSVTWLASWTENIQGSIKYIMLNANSKLKGEKDWEKYEVARKLKTCVDSIRNQYLLDLKSKEMVRRQRAVALYFIDKLALRAGNEKEEGETADTVGCCSLRVEHISLHEKLDGSECVVEFDFLGKDSIRYYNKVPVIRKVFKNLKLFLENKQPGDDVFDRLNTGILNKHLSSLMPGLSAKVFRTYNASITLQQQLKELTNKSDNVAEKLLSYNRANRAVAVLCNHQRAPPKTFEQSMATLQGKIDARKEQLSLAQTELKQAKKEAKSKGNSDPKLQTVVERKKAAVKRCEEQLLKMEIQATDREENKQIALGTSKLNYLDPRISVACCFSSWTLISFFRSDGCGGGSAGGGRGRIVDVAVLAGVLRHGVWRSSALRSSVPGDPEEQQHRRFLHQSLLRAAHRQHPAHFLLDREAVRGDAAAAEPGDDPHHVPHAAPLLLRPQLQPGQHQAAPPLRPEPAVLLEVERVRGLPAVLLRLHVAVRRRHAAAARLLRVRGDARIVGSAVRGHAGTPTAAAEPGEPFHQRHECEDGAAVDGRRRLQDLLLRSERKSGSVLGLRFGPDPDRRVDPAAGSDLQPGLTAQTGLT